MILKEFLTATEWARRAATAIMATTALAAPAAMADDDAEAPPKTPYQIVNEAPDEAWRTVDPASMMIMDLPSGEIVIEMRADFAPKHVAQVSALVNQGFYNGLKFHRVIEGFMAQGGDPKGDGTGGSSLPNIPGEFVKRSETVEDFAVIGRDRVAARIGFVNGMPAAAEPESLRAFRTDRQVRVWPAHCPGVMSMARSTPPDSANSQFFLMIGDARDSLDTRYSAWGLIVDGFENSRRISRGEPPTRPTPIVRIRMGANVPADELKKIEVLDTNHEVFATYLETAGYVKDGLVKDLCKVRAPRRVNGKVEL